MYRKKRPPVSLYLHHASFMSINGFDSCEKTHKIDELPDHKSQTDKTPEGTNAEM